METTVGILSAITDIRIIDVANNALIEYFGGNGYYRLYYRGIYLIELILQLLLVVFLYILKKDKNTSFSIVLSILILLLLPKTVLMIRFAPLALYVAMISIIQLGDKKGKNMLLLAGLMLAIVASGVVCSFTTLLPHGYNGEILNHITRPIYSYFQVR